MAFRTNKTPVLQTKSASGSVATFNTALAMPLVSCNIAVNAWQEGSGDPSPVNNRTIHGFSEVNLTANNVIHTIQLGQEVYGGVLDLGSGVLHVTHAYYKTTGNKSVSAYDYNNQHGVHFGAVLPTTQNRPSYISNMSKYTPVGMLSSGAIWCGVNNGNILYWIGILDILNMTLEEFKLWIVDNPLEVAYSMDSEDQFTVQLTPVQIDTILNTNNIFADTGDIDLTFKDLDIAKRGNFREVFRLPS